MEITNAVRATGFRRPPPSEASSTFSAADTPSRTESPVPNTIVNGRELPTLFRPNEVGEARAFFDELGGGRKRGGGSTPRGMTPLPQQRPMTTRPAVSNFGAPRTATPVRAPIRAGPMASMSTNAAVVAPSGSAPFQGVPPHKQAAAAKQATAPTRSATLVERDSVAALPTPVSAPKSSSFQQALVDPSAKVQVKKEVNDDLTAKAPQATSPIPKNSGLEEDPAPAKPAFQFNAGPKKDYVALTASASLTNKEAKKENTAPIKPAIEIKTKYKLTGSGGSDAKVVKDLAAELKEMAKLEREKKSEQARTVMDNANDFEDSMEVAGLRERAAREKAAELRGKVAEFAGAATELRARAAELRGKAEMNRPLEEDEAVAEDQVKKQQDIAAASKAPVRQRATSPMKSNTVANCSVPGASALDDNPNALHHPAAFNPSASTSAAAQLHLSVSGEDDFLAAVNVHLKIKAKKVAAKKELDALSARINQVKLELTSLEEEEEAACIKVETIANAYEVEKKLAKLKLQQE